MKCWLIKVRRQRAVIMKSSKISSSPISNIAARNLMLLWYLMVMPIWVVAIRMPVRILAYRAIPASTTIEIITIQTTTAPSNIARIHLHTNISGRLQRRLMTINMEKVNFSTMVVVLVDILTCHFINMMPISRRMRKKWCANIPIINSGIAIIIVGECG